MRLGHVAFRVCGFVSAVLMLCGAARAAEREVTLAWGQATLRLSAQAVPLSLTLKGDATECLNTRRPGPLAEVQAADGAWHPADALRRQGDALELGFKGTDTSVTLAVEPREGWVTLRVAKVGGTRPKAVRFVSLAPAFTQTVGTRLNIGWDNTHALCVMGVSPSTETQVKGHAQVSMAETVAAIDRGEGGAIPDVRLTAAAPDAPGPRIEGAAAAIIACRVGAFKGVAREVSHAYGLPVNETADGTPVKDTALVKGSYLFLSAGLEDAERVIGLCEASGIRKVLLNADAWCSPSGQYTINPKHFPNGVESLKAFVARLKASGITAGMHCHVPKVGQTGADVTPTAEARLAEIFNVCGFGMVFFDGRGEAETPRFDYYVSTFQADAMRRFNRPVVHMGSVMTHRLWHSFALGSTVDTYLKTFAEGRSLEKWPTVKQHIDTSVAYMLRVRGDMMPGELGWFGVWPRQQRQGREVEGLQLDELEYLMSRSVAFDCPVSLQTRFHDLERHPLTPEILRIFKAYETVRLGGRVPETIRAPMREPGREFILLQRRGSGPFFVEAKPVLCGGNADTRAMVGKFEGGSVATFWHAAGSASVTLNLLPTEARVADFDDQRVVVGKSPDGKLVIPVTTRRLTVTCPKLDPAALEQKIKNSLCTPVSTVYK